MENYYPHGSNPIFFSSKEIEKVRQAVDNALLRTWLALIGLGLAGFCAVTYTVIWTG